MLSLQTKRNLNNATINKWKGNRNYDPLIRVIYDSNIESKCSCHPTKYYILEHGQILVDFKENEYAERTVKL